ncbi:hypothetical protein KFZ76_22950 [Methylovulum psychrotolerans]|uniref:hypothetical protein n=1 Tax=Methylovulum psychrotolerans TaxID=1704499 RepID=UPI001BFF2670|nr:hypothetical protein [Methylovulum psychrotolerans]MBT9100563.1 hypothetical protein [Methylovulum psychrotolerans]
MKKAVALVRVDGFFFFENYIFVLSLPNSFSNSPLFLAVGSDWAGLVGSSFGSGR